MKWYSVREIQHIFNLSRTTAHRIVEPKVLPSKYTKRGKRNAILVNNKGISYLESHNIKRHSQKRRTKTVSSSISGTLQYLKSQNAHLTQLLDHEQQLHLADNKYRDEQIKQLKSSNKKYQALTYHEKHRGFWARLFNR